MPNIFKRFSSWVNNAEPYQFPDALELLKQDDPNLNQLEEDDGWTQLGGSDSGEEAEGLRELEEAEDVSQAEEEEPEEPENPLDYAQIQVEMILEDARREAEDILAKARLDAQLEADRIRAAAREEGHQEGYLDGLAQGRREAAQELDARAATQAAEVEKFLEQAGAALDRQMDESVNELRDLAMAVAEKVICISLKSSGDVICRMIQTAVDKRKRREWVHIYISECDAKRLGQIPASLTASLSALSGRVRVIPMADDESGTCIIEMPDEIVDASAGTQLNNIRGLLMDTASSTGGASLF